MIKEKGYNNLTVEDLKNEITPKGRQTVPDVVKKELLVKIQSYLAQQHNFWTMDDKYV